MKRRFLSTLVLVLGLTAAIGPAAIAADLTDVGFIDQSALGESPRLRQREPAARGV